MLPDDYIAMMNAARKKYGDRCLVLMQVGSFYEVYDTTDAEESFALGICERLLHLRVANKNVTTMVGGKPQPVYMAGIPVDSFVRYRSVLLDRNFVLLMVTQDETDSTHRRLTRIISPGVDEEAGESAAVVVLIVERTAHMCRYDTQINRIDMHTTACGDSLTALLDGVRLWINESGGCNEVEFHIDDVDYHEPFDVTSAFASVAVHVHDLRQVPRKFLFDRRWQCRCLESHYFRLRGIGDDIIGKLGLSDASSKAVAALVLLAIFLRQHDEDVVRILPVPHKGADNCGRLSLLGNTIHTLNIVGGQGLSVLDIFARRVRTAMGKRAMRHRLRHPIRDAHILAQRFGELAFFQKRPLELSRIHDLSQIACRWRQRRVRASDLGRIIASHASALNVLRALHDAPSSVLPSREALDALAHAVRLFGQLFDQTASGTDVFAQTELLDAMDELNLSDLVLARRELQSATEAVETVQKAIDTELALTNASQLNSTRTGYQLNVSTSRGKALAARGWKLTFSKKDTRVDDDAVDALSDANAHFEQRCATAFDTCVAHLNTIYFDKFADEIAASIGLIDMTHAVAMHALKANYCRPSIEDSATGGFAATGLRHPIIEDLIEPHGHAYVKHDVRVDPENSMLMYGVNSAGKSSLAKAIACAVHLAQCGFFVPASTCTVRLYSTMVVHVGGRDDMYRAQSTFVKEVEDLRSVLRASKKDGGRTLFIADELGNSTEDTSAEKIVSAVLHTFHARKVTMMIATHMFSLQDNAFVQGLHGLRNFHLEVAFRDDGRIVFNRTLVRGLPPTREYGCRIAARLLEEDDEFVRLLNSDWHRRKTPVPKQCRYNRSVFADACVFCDYRPTKSSDKPIAWHHLEEQATAVNGLVPSGKPVHASSNLAPACNECHDAVHAGKIVVHGFVQSSHGRMLEFERCA